MHSSYKGKHNSNMYMCPHHDNKYQHKNRIRFLKDIQLKDRDKLHNHVHNLHLHPFSHNIQFYKYIQEEDFYLLHPNHKQLNKSYQLYNVHKDKYKQDIIYFQHSI